MLKLKAAKNVKLTFINIRTKATVGVAEGSALEKELFHQQIHDIPFSRAKIGRFFQQQPKLGNQFTEDVTLQAYLKRYMPEKIFRAVTPDLESFGDRVGSEIYDLHLECDKPANLPRLVHYNAWGKRVDEIITCEAWKQQKKISAEEGLIAIAYERNYGEFSRLYQMAKMYLYHPSAGLFGCPLAMTDGAAKSLEVIGDKALLEGPFSHLISRDPNKFWTSGQWMTEKKGGSDVANGTETLAVPQDDGTSKLYGYKWFTSATESDMTLTLARVVNKQGEVIQGTRGLSMFFLEVRDSEGQLNNIEVQRLKDKLGTRQVPTAELLLDGVTAHRVSEEGRGVPSIANMLILTRMHNAVSSAGCMRRVINLARDYSTKRECFTKLIKDHPLHIKNMANMEVEARGSLLLTMDMARLLGYEECNVATDTEKEIFRLMTPVMKLYTAKQAMSVASEGLECFGGMGYLEDSGLPGILRDAQVLPIWEGTTNILSLDVLRAIAKSRGMALQAFKQHVSDRIQSASGKQELAECCSALQKALMDILSFAQNHTDKLEIAGREFAYSLGSTYIGMLLVEHANWENATPQDVMVAQRWCQKELAPVVHQQNLRNYDNNMQELEMDLVFDGYVPTETESKL